MRFNSLWLKRVDLEMLVLGGLSPFDPDFQLTLLKCIYSVKGTHSNLDFGITRKLIVFS